MKLIKEFKRTGDGLLDNIIAGFRLDDLALQAIGVRRKGCIRAIDVLKYKNL